jgi:hypothetical protein
MRRKGFIGVAAAGARDDQTSVPATDAIALASAKDSGGSDGTPAWAIALPAVGVVAAGGLGYRLRRSRRKLA